MPDLQILEERLGYHFRDEALLRRALTHPSYASEHAAPHYQRLEFLGDAVLELSVSRRLYDALPDMDEGRLTRLRASLVREEALSKAAAGIGLGEFMRLSHGEERSGGREKPAILCDVFESVLAAVYLDGGYGPADEMARRLLGEDFDRNAAADPDRLDAKSALQEALQGAGGMPEYRQLSVEGPPHAPIYAYEVCLNGAALGQGKGGSKQAAQQAAARMALEKQKKENK